MLSAGVVLLLAGAVAGGIATLAKWLIVGPIRAVEHPLWSSFVWRNEVSDTFIEMVAAPWFANAAAGTPVLTCGCARWAPRSAAASGARGTGCPRPTSSTLGDGATVNRGCVVQTHLFHDRVMSMDTVTLEAGATLGPHSVILPAASIGADATVGPASLVMRGEDGPGRHPLEGNPIGPWRFHAERARSRASYRGRCRVSKPRRPNRATGHRPLHAAERQRRLPGVALRARRWTTRSPPTG